MRRTKLITLFCTLALNNVYFSNSALAEEKKETAATNTASQSKPSAANEQTKNEEVDISDIQNQYWKAKDNRFEVIQNKLFTKAGRFELTPIFGFYQRVSYQDSMTPGAAVGFHFSEILGLEFMGYKNINSDSTILKSFKDTRGATIEFNEEKYYLGTGLVFTPIYGKFSLLGKKISHFDMYIEPTIGVTKTMNNNFTYGFAIGQKFWLSQRFNLRLEYRVQRYNDRINTTQGATAIRNGGPGYYDDTITNQNLIFGIGFLF